MDEKLIEMINRRYPDQTLTHYNNDWFFLDNGIGYSWSNLITNTRSLESHNIFTSEEEQYALDKIDEWYKNEDKIDVWVNRKIKYPNRYLDYSKIISGQHRFYWLKKGKKYYPLDRVNISRFQVEHSLLVKTKSGKKQKRVIVFEDFNSKDILSIKERYKNRIHTNFL